MMYLLTIVFGNATIGLMYRAKEKAEEHYGFMLQGAGEYQRVQLEDDFGQRATVEPKSLHGAILEDMEASKVARAEQMVHQVRCQGLAQKLAQADSGLSAMRGPSVLTPSMGPLNGFRG